VRPPPPADRIRIYCVRRWLLELEEAVDRHRRRLEQLVTDRNRAADLLQRLVDRARHDDQGDDEAHP